MHGAGLVNAFFMRPGAALVEIFPCRFGDNHQKNYFWHPSHVGEQGDRRLKNSGICSSV